MKIKKHAFLFLLALLHTVGVWAQQPQNFSYSSENNLPSNEVYSLLQDKKGFIWIGCDAGLCRFDGINYTLYTCLTQKSKSMTGLTCSSSGMLYCYNFQSQIFYYNNALSYSDSNTVLTELPHKLGTIISLVSDKQGNIYVSHKEGLSSYNEKTKKWTNHYKNHSQSQIDNIPLSAKSIKGDMREEIFFIDPRGIGKIVDNKIQITESDLFKTVASGKFELECYKNKLWIFSIGNNLIYTYEQRKEEPVKNEKLLTALYNRKITAVKSLADGRLWICTYKGVICYNASTDSVQLFYPDLSFSDCMIDREGNYWFSTLLSGMIRVQNLNYTVWKNFPNNKLTKITSGDDFIYTANVSGTVFRLNTQSNQISLYHTGNSADVQSLDYDSESRTLWFNVNNQLYTLKNEHVRKEESDIRPVKSRKMLNGYSFKATSHGTYANEKKISREWSREMFYDSLSGYLWVASDNGLLKFELQEGNWIEIDRLFKNTQILSIFQEATNQTIIALAFDGKIYKVSVSGGIALQYTLPHVVQPRRIRQRNEKLYIATNKGLWIYDAKNARTEVVNTLSGLASNDVQDLTIVHENIWLATANGLQKIPLNRTSQLPLAKINLKKININGRYARLEPEIELQRGEELQLYPEASIYSSNGNFEYAYRIKSQNNNWNYLPSNVQSIQLANIPSGDFELELKVIDHLGRDSENKIIITGYVKPPFWQTWWFYVLAALLFIVLVFFVALKLIAGIRRREQEKANLINSQLTALKAQMNPHFMFNTLNSIQALILKNDIRNSNLYLIKFSHLMRKVLDVSGRERINLYEELEILELYLSLEKLRFGNDFIYTISVSETIDTHAVTLPPLILQPFVENAIKHGLLHKTGLKHLSIDFSKEEKLICRITDNGIGRERAQQIKERMHGKQPSFSTQATEKRVQLLNHVSDKKMELLIKDLHANGLASGTEVIINIPL